MVTFKNNNADSDRLTSPRSSTQSDFAGPARIDVFDHLRRHDSPIHCCAGVGSSFSIRNLRTVQPDCALHSRLEQPVTSATPGMDNKKVVQSAASVSMPVSVRGKGDVSSGAAAVVTSGTSVSGVRRRSGSQGLRSPAAKRPVSAPVALQGWLHKQGSEGLMLWKKRWFVLSEYCLFYYKGPEEEKLLGSILLPSYRITVCKPEDKVNKKFAFKAEHANMRTYHFAADSREAMNQWVNALTLATLLQDPSPGVGEAAMVIEIAGQHGANGDRSARPSVSSISSILNQSADDSDSGFHGFQSRDDPSHASNNNSSPNSVNTASFPNLTGNGANNGNNNNDVANNANNEIPPMVNGWIQQQQHVSHGQLNTPQQQQQQQQQYVQSMHPSQEQSHHSHSYQAMLRQHFTYSNTDQSQNYQYKRAVQQQQQQQQQQQSRLITSGNVQTVQPMPRKFGQPIYANAPPKPRRLADGTTEYSTPSPDPDCRKSPVSPDVASTGKSPLSDYDKNSLIYGTRTGQPPQQSSRTDKLGLNYGSNMSTSAAYGQVQMQERRTPDTYGRSAAKPRSSRGNGDYEEVYGTPQLYQRPAGPVGYVKGSSPAPIPIPVYAQHHQHQIHSPVSVSSSATITRQARAQPPPRPHSADFLEYESSRKPHQRLTPTTARCEESLNQLQRRPQRPKSSLDIVATSDATNDGYFYSEERYAAQMRQSAVYLHQTPQQHQQRRNQSLSRATMPSNETETGTGTGIEADMETRTEMTGIRDESRISTMPESLRSSGIRRDHVHQQHAMPHQSFQRHIEVGSSEGSKLRRSLREPSYESSASIRETMMSQASDTRDTDGVVDSVRRIPRREYEWGVRPAARVGPTCHAASNRRWNEQQQQQFCRSASARLPRTRHPAAFDPDDEDYGEPSSEQDSRDGERKIQQREESMKRLLEWKQRMLQSPLTRKPSASANRGRARNEQLSNYYKQQALLELAAQEACVAAAGAGGIDAAEARHSRRREDGHRAHVRSKSSDARRNVVNVPRYNSYSSDDEEMGDDVRKKRTRRPSHAGRSPRHLVRGEDRSPIRERASGGIPPDAGYEEVSFPSPSAVRSPAAKYLPSERGNRRGAPVPIEARTEENERDVDPSGSSSAADAWWPVRKTVQWAVDEGENEKRKKRDKDDWESRIDETKLIKEFSYHYIKYKTESRSENEEDEKNESHDETTETTNLVRCRIRSFEPSGGENGTGKETLAMQEPLKVSPVQATEAHVSKLDRSKNGGSSVIRSFALGETDRREGTVEDGHAKQASTDSNKSVKDLLADFERKSRRVEERSRREFDSRRREAKHHAASSDSEALFHEAGSDLDRWRDTERPEENEENRRNSKTDDTGGEINVSFEDESSSSRNRLEDVSTEDLDAAPANRGSSPTESLLTHGDRLSGDSGNASPTAKKREEEEEEDVNPEEHYLPMSPRKAILDPNDDDDRPNPKMMESLFANLEREESSYVEMTRNGITRSLLADDAGDPRDSGDYSTLDAPHYEFVCVSDSKVEPVYMEVSQLSEPEKENNAGRDREDDRKTTSNNNRRSGEDRTTHSAHSRSTDLPDILTALKSDDSSDADDESSKDLDSIDAPRHPRFSLSDTFRPASYYLGASRAMIAELHDSSDSELVSPPPIPTSPPPLDDLDSLGLRESLETKKAGASAKPVAMGQVETQRPPSRFSDATTGSTFRDSRISLESASGSDSVAAEFRTLEEETRHRQLKTRPVSELCEETVLDGLDELESLGGSRFDGVSIDLDRYLEELRARDAFNVDLYAKEHLGYGGSVYGFNENTACVDKLRKTACRDLSARPNQDAGGYDASNKMGSASSLPSMRVCDVSPSVHHQHSQSFTGDSHYENVSSFSPLQQSVARSNPTCDRDRHPTAIVSHTRDSSYPFRDSSIRTSTFASAVGRRPASAQSSTNSYAYSSGNRLGNNSDGGEPRTASPYSASGFRVAVHSRSASQDSAGHSKSPSSREDSSRRYPSSTSAAARSYLPEEPRARGESASAPYYYSDLRPSPNTAGTEPGKPLVGHTSRLPQLNNQRDDASALNKRNDIGRIVNPISRQIPKQIRVDDIDEARRIAAELRRTSCQLLADDKADLVDKRNFYEADTLRRVKSTDPLPDISTDISAWRNLYPHGLRDKSNTNRDNCRRQVEPPQTSSSHRRSRSLEGLLDDVGLQNLVERRSRNERAMATGEPTTSRRVEPETTNTELDVISTNSSTFANVQDPWEQDSLWRESLRRVSLRNARSLDNLDDPPRTTNAPGFDAKGRNKITRGATYVNDSVASRREDRARKSAKRETNEEDEREEDEGAYESSATERVYDGDAYAWDSRDEIRGNEATEEDKDHFLEKGNLPPIGSEMERRQQQQQRALFEFDREKLRQWDLLSSACLLQEQQRGSMADSGRGLPVAEQRSGDVPCTRTTNASTAAAVDRTSLDGRGGGIASKAAVDATISRTNDAGQREPNETNEARDGVTPASGSGSVIGRDPLPPRAVSTSQLAQRRSPQVLPPAMATVSTLPLTRSNAAHRQSPLPLHQSTPRSTRQSENDFTDSHLLRVASSGDVVGTGSSPVMNNFEGKDTRLTSSMGRSTVQRLTSPAGQLRPVPFNDRRVSSSCDSDVRVHSPIERQMASPIGREADRSSGSGSGSGRGSVTRQSQYAWECNELLLKRSNAGCQRIEGSGHPGAQAGVVRFSAGELLGRTHEELVLLLIQLRRQNAIIYKAMETCQVEIEAQARLAELDTPRRLENLRKLDELKKHLMDLEKQYEKGKPLVNLVDNMVKLGSLYNPNTVNGIGSVAGAGSRHDLTHDGARDHRLEFNQKIQEQRLLAEERRDWDRLSPDHGQLQAKVQQLYKLDRLLQEESGTLHSLQQDKEMLEKALGGLRHKLQGNRSNLAETERYRKQQLLLERELSRVRALLAHNSKKLEETVAENARLEQELVVLRQKLQASRRYAGNVTRDTSATTGPLEAELRRVQQLVGDLQRQRKELSVQVRQLTEKSHSLVQQIRPQPSSGSINTSTPQVHQSKKRTQNSWLETDLDSGITLDHGLDSPSSPSLSSSPCGKQNGGSYLSHYGSTTQIKDPSPTTRQQLYQHPHRSHHMSSLAPQLREQIHQHQLKQQLLKDQMQGKGSMMQANIAPLYVNTDSRIQENGSQEERLTNGTISPPEYIPPPPPPPLPLNDEASLNDNYRQNEDNKFTGSSMHNREKQEIKTVRIVKRESERRQRDRGDRTGNLGIPLTNGLQAPGGAKRLCDDDLGGSQKFEKGQLGKVIEEPPMIHAQSTVQLTELDDVQFQRSMSLPRGFGGQRHQHHRQPEIHQVPVVPPPRSDSMHALRTMLARRNKLRFDYQDGSSDSTLSPYTESLGSSSHVPVGSPSYSTSSPSYSPSQQSYPPVRASQSPRYYPPPAPSFRQYETHRPRAQEPTSPESFSPMGIDGQGRTFDSTLNVNAAPNSPQLSPVFKSEAAKQIIKEMTERKVDGPRRRQIPREKRRHYTVSSSKPILDLEDTFAKMGMGRARDDLDMERALRPRINAPDVVRSTLSHKELKYNESTIDQLLGTPNKIVIPERYIPEQTPELTAEEQEQRLKKAEAIRKMLSETTVTAPDGNDDNVVEQSDNLKKKVVEEKRQRDHILQLNQILAKQVMEKSKMVAVNALATLPLKTESSLEDDDLSPVTPLPLYQQRENYYS